MPMFIDLDCQINKSKTLVADSLQQVNQTILECISSDINSDLLFLINQYIISSIGKQLRPLLLLLSANSVSYLKDHKIQNINNIKLAAAVELIHLASLFHDDVIDNSQIRRNKKTINAEFDNKCAILAGDFLYAKAFNLISKIDSPNNNQLICLIAETANLMVTGEMLQLSERYNFAITEERYLQIITAKTAQLFLATMQLPTILNLETLDSANVNSRVLAECGLNFGIAYQLLDDIFDYYKFGNDITEGRITLPIIFLLNNSDKNVRQSIMKIIQNYTNLNNFQQLEQLQLLKNIVLNNGGFDYSFNLAKQYLIKAKAAISILMESEYKQAIEQIIGCFLTMP